MKFKTVITNELPFMIELQDGTYEVNTTTGIVAITLNSDWYKLHTARFADYADKQPYVGEKEALQEIIEKQKIPNYAFGSCKTFVSCEFSEDYVFTDIDLETITREQCIEKIKTLLIQQKVKYESTGNLHEMALKEFDTMSADQIIAIKKRILIDDKFASIHKVYMFYEGLNSLLKQYAYIRKFFWIEKLDENMLEGTLIQDFLDDAYYTSVTFVGLVPSILPSKRKYPDLKEVEIEDLKNRLAAEIPIEEELILVARSLWYRLEYRSAVIESSAALEIAVEKKLIEKMRAISMNRRAIDSTLYQTRYDFRTRCDCYLKKYTGQSFVINNSELWTLINGHRNNYRHKIAHSSVMPDKQKTGDIINDFEQAIKYINSL